MLSWAVTFLIIAIIAGLLGFKGIEGVAASIAKVLFFLFLVVFVVALLLGSSFFGRSSPNPATPAPVESVGSSR